MLVVLTRTAALRERRPRSRQSKASTGFGIAITLLGTASLTNAQGKSENYNQYEFVSSFSFTLMVDVT